MVCVEHTIVVKEHPVVCMWMLFCACVCANGRFCIERISICMTCVFIAPAVHFCLLGGQHRCFLHFLFMSSIHLLLSTHLPAISIISMPYPPCPSSHSWLDRCLDLSSQCSLLALGLIELFFRQLFSCFVVLATMVLPVFGLTVILFTDPHLSARLSTTQSVYLPVTEPPPVCIPACS